MGEFIIGAVVILVLWFFFSVRSKTKSYQAFNAIDEAETWLSREGIKPFSVYFSSYDNPGLPKNQGASVIVGTGDKSDGSKVGFVLEVVQGSGVVESAYLEPWGTATHHRIASQTAKMNGLYLIDVMQEMARQHRSRHSGQLPNRANSLEDARLRNDEQRRRNGVYSSNQEGKGRE